MRLCAPLRFDSKHNISQGYRAIHEAFRKVKWWIEKINNKNTLNEREINGLFESISILLKLPKDHRMGQMHKHFLLPLIPSATTMFILDEYILEISIAWFVVFSAYAHIRATRYAARSGGCSSSSFACSYTPFIPFNESEETNKCHNLW